MLYIVEHLEEGDKLSDWARLEYRHMQQTVVGDTLLFTNVKSEGVRKELETWSNTRTVAFSL
jgi:ribosome biogenesis SPOUT family RNA methylase Rps3